MARKFEYKPGGFAWNPEKCEEIVVIAGYDEIARYVPPDQVWKVEFENHFFGHGNGLAFDHLD